MSIKYYNEFDEKRHIRKYDTANGVRKWGTLFQPENIIYHNSIIVGELFDTIDNALKGWGEYSEKDIELPDGTITTPLMRFHPNDIDNILTPYYPGTVAYLFGRIPEIL